MADTRPAPPTPSDDLVRQLFAVLSPALGEDFFHSLTEHLTQTCGVDYALVGKLVGPDLQRVQTLAVAHRGVALPNFEYDLAGTPCAAVIGKLPCHFEAGVADRFPADRMLRDLGIESYLGTPLFAEHGSPIGILALMHCRRLPDLHATTAVLRFAADRTAAELERVTALRSLRASEARLAAVLDGSPSVAVQWYDRSGRILRWNRASEIMFGFAAAEAVGKRLVDLIHTPEEMAGFLQVLAEVERNGKAAEPCEYTFRRRNGEQGTCWSTVFQIPGEGDAPWFVCMDVDITDRKLAEEHRARIEQQMQRAQKLESLGVLAGGVAHDFNNLLTSILGHSDLLAGELPAGSATRIHLREIDVAARRAAELRGRCSPTPAVATSCRHRSAWPRPPARWRPCCTRWRRARSTFGSSWCLRSSTATPRNCSRW